MDNVLWYSLLSYRSLQSFAWLPRVSLVLQIGTSVMACALQSVDLLLIAWDQACAQLERAEASYEKIGGVKRPTHRLRCCGNIGKYESSSHPAKCFMGSCCQFCSNGIGSIGKSCCSWAVMPKPRIRCLHGRCLLM